MKTPTTWLWPAGLAASLFLTGFPCAAEELQFLQTKALCMANAAEPSAVFAAAEADGWTDKSDDKGILALMNMYPSGDWRAKSIGGDQLLLRVTTKDVPSQDGRKVVARGCVVADDHADPAASEAAARDFFRADASQATAEMAMWMYILQDGQKVFLRGPQMESAAIYGYLKTGPVYALMVGLSPDATGVIYSEMVSEPQ